MRPKNAIWKRVLLSAWLVWLLDIGTKTWALASLSDKSSVRILGDFLTLTLTKNSGAAFSFATGGAAVLGLFAIVVVFAIGYWAPKITSRPWGYVLGLVLGGSLGNLTDRLFRSSGKSGVFKGEVIDWIRVPHWPIFNIADSAIVVAAVVATILSIRNISPITDRRSDDSSQHKTHSQDEDTNGP